MKHVAFTQFYKEYKSWLRKIPKEGVILTVDGKPKWHMRPADLVEIQEAVGKKAEEALVSLDTFTQVPKREDAYFMGICSRCGTHGEVLKRQYLNEHGKYVGGQLCKAKCFVKLKVPPRELIKVQPKENTFNSTSKPNDFGGSNVRHSF